MGVDPSRLILYTDDLVQDCSNSIANALQLLQSCTNHSIYCWNSRICEHRVTIMNVFRRWTGSSLIQTFYPQIPRGPETGYYHDCIALKFDRHIGSGAIDMLIKLQSDWEKIKPA